MPPRPNTARLLIACPDCRGIVAKVAGFVSLHGGNILELDQHTDPEDGDFFMRVEFDVAGCDLNRDNFDAAWSPMAGNGMHWQIRWSEDIKRMGILVGRQPHCLHDLLWRHQSGELDAEIPIVISNHPDLAPVVESAGIQFLHLPITGGDKANQERAITARVAEAGCDFLVLARYMQILTPTFLEGWRNRIINIHHSFLPAFAGGDPYRQAHERGVKLIGATSHYVTEELDAGPIITQVVAEVSHRDTVADLRRKGRDLERMGLAAAVRHHIEDGVLVSGNKTVVFE